MLRNITDRRESADQQAAKKELKEPEHEWLTAFVAQFDLNIKKPIELRQSLMKNNQLQRCLTHNIIYSIYCTICRKILCASCMYTSTQHRKHRVVPVENAIEDIRDDLKGFSARVPKIIQQCDGITSSNNQYMVRVERQFNPILSRIQDFYENLRSYIKVKEKQQLHFLKEKRDSMRSQVNAYNSELTKIQQYVTEKFKSYANTNIKTELLLPARNIMENILQTSVFVKQPQIDTDNLKFNIDGDKIKVGFEQIVMKINGFVPQFDSNFKVRKQFSSKSLDEKSKSVSFVGEGKKRQQKIRWQKKRENTSLTGSKVIRK